MSVESENKAKELVEKYYDALYEKVLDISDRMRLAKQCALIAVEEILIVLGNPTHFIVTRTFYLKVKEEIQKL